MIFRNLSALSPLWLRSLQDYARIRLESDIMALTSSAEGIQTTSSGGIESLYSAATKQVVLPVSCRVSEKEKPPFFVLI